MFKSGDDNHGLETDRVHESHHLTADRAGAVLCVAFLPETISDREARILFEETRGLLREDDRGLVVDLARVTVLTSAGIGTLVRLHKQIGERGGKFSVCGLSGELDELFRLTRMDRLFLLHEDREQALGEIRS